ncbi:MAG: IS66 family insertion sequence element accessory protein TnpA [Lysobacter sp.]
MDKTSKREAWARRLAAFEGSGLSRRAWCKAQGVNVHTLDYWRRRLRASPARSAALVPIMVRAETSPPMSVAMMFEWPNGLRLRVPSDANVLDVAAWVRALAPC